MKKLLLLALVALFATSAMADTMSFGWETGTPDLLGLYGSGEPPIIATVATTPVYSGMYSLQLEDNSPSGTPQAYIAWVTGLSDGDEVTAGFWRFDDTPGASPSVRIWGNWNDTEDVSGYSGSASGNGDYGEGLGWDYHEYTWTVVDGHTGLTITARTYSAEGDTAWIDDLSVTAPEGCVIHMPDGSVPVEDATISQIKALY